MQIQKINTSALPYWQYGTGYRFRKMCLNLWNENVFRSLV